jgi:hypothetical protein
MGRSRQREKAARLIQRTIQCRVKKLKKRSGLDRTKPPTLGASIG